MAIGPGKFGALKVPRTFFSVIQQGDILFWGGKVVKEHIDEIVVDTELAGQPIRLVTRPGFPKWGHIDAALELVASHVAIEAGERVLICPCGHGALGVWAASRTLPGQVMLLDTHTLAVQAARRTLEENGCPHVNVEVGLPSESLGPVDVVILLLPKGRDLARLYLLNAAEQLIPGGRLYLVGANREGIKSIGRDAELLLGASTVLAYKHGTRILAFKRPVSLPEPLPTPFQEPGIRNGTFARFRVEIMGHSLIICSRPGVFSRKRLDVGTRLLLENLHVRSDDRVLDVGCGYGVIGALVAKLAPRAQVTMVDVDWLAWECARETLAMNDIEGVELLLGDGLNAVGGRHFSLIVSNPPFHVGHANDLGVTERFLLGARDHLTANGRLVIVANRFLAYHRTLNQAFGRVDVLAQNKQYRVLRAWRRRKGRRGYRA